MVKQKEKKEKYLKSGRRLKVRIKVTSIGSVSCSFSVSRMYDRSDGRNMFELMQLIK